MKQPLQTFQVSQFLDYLNQLMVDEIDYRVEGEITGFQKHSSGIYFSLKDPKDGTILNCYMYPRAYYGLGLNLEDGMLIKIRGQTSIYKPKGKLSFAVTLIQLAGEGSFKRAYELLKKQLAHEGLFDRKRPLPEFIQNIGLITSRTGAVINDFRTNLEILGFKIYFYNVRVEGNQATTMIIEAINWFHKHKLNLDVLVIMRGGGSLEDLQAFNNEQLARVIFGCQIPTISAIGHDRDVPIASLVSDLAVSTPTAAAMTINESWQRLEQQISLRTYGLMSTCEQLLNSTEQRLRYNKEIVITRFEHMLSNITTTLDHSTQYLSSSNPEQILQRGYSLVFDEQHHLIRSNKQVRSGTQLTIKLAQGTLKSIVSKNNNEN